MSDKNLDPAQNSLALFVFAVWKCRKHWDEKVATKCFKYTLCTGIQV